MTKDDPRDINPDDAPEIMTELIAQADDWVKGFVFAQCRAGNPYAADLTGLVFAKFAQVLAGLGMSADELADNVRRYAAMPIKIVMEGDDDDGDDGADPVIGGGAN